MEVKKVSRSGKRVTVTLGNWEEVGGTELLTATGRNAKTHDMGLEKVGGPSEGAWFNVDDSMCATAVKNKWLSAVGDPNELALMTHNPKYQAKVAGGTIVAKSKGIYQSEVVGEMFNTLTSSQASSPPLKVFSPIRRLLLLV